jgi:hypothetical protein
MGGNPEVRHDQSLHASVGVIWKILPSLSLEATGFYKHLWNRVAPSDHVVWRGGAPMSESVWNHGIGRIYGAELLIKQQFSRACPRFLRLERCFGWLSYTILRSERRDQPGTGWRLFDFDQTHILTLVLSGLWPHGWQFGIRFRFASGNPVTRFGTGIYDADADLYIGVPGPYNGFRMPPFHQLDLRLDKKFTFKRWTLSVYLDIQNVYYYRAPEFLWYNFNFTQQDYFKGLPIIPSIGVKGAF